MKQIVSLSGGKDSTAMLLMMLERGEQIDDIVFFDWGMEFPAMYEHLNKLEDYIKRPITRLYPPHSFEYYLYEHTKIKGKRKGERGYGFPYWIKRWCSRIKADALNKAYPNSVMCIGFSYEERFSRAKPASRWQNSQNITPRYPLLEWGVSETEALKYCQARGFNWGGLYQIFDRVSCWCCPFQTPDGFRKLKRYFPQLWDYQLELMRKTPYPHPQEESIESLKEIDGGH